jgi:ubiquinone/menaquinone biosynthesis C-methylase UbiE
MAEEHKAHPWWNLVRFGFRLLYNEFAFTYDLVSKTVSLGAWRCWQRTALKHLHAEPGSCILEIAHGTGDLQLDLNTAGFKVVGHDLSRNMGHITQAKLNRHSLPSRLSRGKAQTLPYPPETFAAVVSTFPAEFILAPETLREVYRVLQPQGHFVIVPNGVLVGSSAVAAGIEWLYRATGQRGEGTPSDDLTAFFDGYGFAADILEEPCPRSVATVIVARKKP